MIRGFLRWIGRLLAPRHLCSRCGAIIRADRERCSDCLEGRK